MPPPPVAFIIYRILPVNASEKAVFPVFSPGGFTPRAAPGRGGQGRLGGRISLKYGSGRWAR
jgi:hypothetical protein